MAWFRCLIRGENFPGVLVDRDYAMGFYIIRLVESANAHEAELAAVESLRSESKLALPDGHAPSPQSRVYVEEMEEVDPVDHRQSGFIWYQMEDEQ
jgi:hypothetical protein